MDLLFAMAPQGGGGDSMVSTLIMFGAIFAIFYFMIIRPQQKKQKETKLFLEAIKKGDTVVTIGGIHAKVYAIEGDTLVLELDKGLKIKVENRVLGN